MGLSPIGHRQMKDEHCFESKVEAVLVNTGKCTELGITIIVDTKHPQYSPQSLLVPPNNVQLWNWNKYVKHSISDQTSDTFNLIDSVEQLWFPSLPRHPLKQSVVLTVADAVVLTVAAGQVMTPFSLTLSPPSIEKPWFQCGASLFNIYSLHWDLSLPFSWLLGS